MKERAMAQSAAKINLAKARVKAAPSYEELFDRNYGVFTREQQERIRGARILIVGCGGIGAAVAVMLARSGVEHFVLVDFDEYTVSNMNRQIGCFGDTLNRPKTDVIAGQILSINPRADVVSMPENLSIPQIAKLMEQADVVFPAADDFAFSIMLFREAARLDKPALFVVPSGEWANVSMMMPGTMSLEDMKGVPKLETYQDLRAMLETRKYKFATFYYMILGGWRKEYYRDFIEKDAPPAQLCPTVWLASALGAREVLKVLSGKSKPVAPPRYWSVTADRVRICNAYLPSVETFFVWQRKIMWRLFQTPAASLMELGQKI